MRDNDIRREVLSIEDILYRSSFDIIFFIESKEMGRHETEILGTISAVSSFQRQKKGHHSKEDKSQHIPCQNCKNLFYTFSEKGNQNKKPFRYCLSCWHQSKKINAVQIRADHSDFMQLDTQIMSLHASKRIMLNYIIFIKNSLRKV